MKNFKPVIDFVSVKTKAKHISFFEEILIAFSGKMDTPTLYGWYHLLCLAIVVGLCILIVCKAKKLSDKQVNVILGCTAALLIFFEIYKQLLFSYDTNTDAWSYQWYAFPFQFCSTPMYVMLTAAFVKNRKLKEALYSFMATYGLFAGSAVMFYPGDVFISEIGINIQTMIHHGAMVVIGVLMYASGKAKISHKTILKALPVFAALVTFALIANILYAQFGDPEQTFNMFFISPYYACTLPILSMLYGNIPYIIFLAIYIFGFSLAGYVMSLLAMGATKLSKTIQRKLPKKSTLSL